MNIGLSSFAIRVMLLFLPGLLGRKVYLKLRGRPPRQDWEAISDIGIFAFFSYASVWWLERPSPLAAYQALFDEKVAIPFGEVLVAVVASIAVAYLASALHRYKIVTLIGRKIPFVPLTNRWGDEDVWEFFQDTPGVEYVLVRDHKLQLNYYGFIKAFSDSEKERELLLGNVLIFDEVTGKRVSDRRLLYLSRQRYDLTIEVPDVGHQTRRPGLWQRMRRRLKGWG